jgi:hypothetical protein
MTTDGFANPIGPFNVPLPHQEGAYELQIGFHREPTLNQLGKVQWAYERRICLVVVAPPSRAWHSPTGREGDVQGEWKILQEIDLADSQAAIANKGNALANNLIGRGDGMRILGNGTVTSVPLANTFVNELGPASYRAIPLVVEQVDRPQMLEFDYPADQPQTLAIAIVEAGQASSAGLAVDRGFTLEAADCAPEKRGTHRLAYWPSTKTPWLVISNPAATTARLGKVRVLGSGGARLKSSDPAPNFRERLVAIDLEDPLFLEAFSAEAPLDSDQTPNADWKTWLDASNRLTEYLRHVGYNGACIPFVHGGGAIYPSSNLPSYVDPLRGTTATQITDPCDKDIAEVLLRLFDREQLRCVPSIRLSGGIRELDELAVKDDGIYLQPPVGDESPANTPRYNILHPQVQEVVRKIVAEIVTRYSRHNSLAGIKLSLNADTCTHLPGVEWGADKATMSRFLREEGIEIPNLARLTSTAELFQKHPEARERWIDWRCQQVAKFYSTLDDEVAKSPKPLKMYLCGPDLAESPEVAIRLRSELTPLDASAIRNLLREKGIDPALLALRQRLILSRPDRLSTLSGEEFDTLSTIHEAWDEAIGSSASGTVAFITRDVRESKLAVPEAMMGSGITSEELRLIGQGSVGNARVRQAWLRRLAHADSEAIFDGGPLPPFGQELAAHDILRGLRQLPPDTFADVTAESPQVAEPVVVRSYQNGTDSLAYVVNPSAWPCNVTLRFELREKCRVDDLCTGKPLESRQEGNLKVLTLALRPHDFVAVAARGTSGKLVRYRVDMDNSAAEELSAIIAQAGERIDQRRSLLKFENASFESPISSEAEISGWQLRAGPRTSVELAGEGKDGKQSLHLASTHPSGGFSVVATTAPLAVKNLKRAGVGVWMRQGKKDGSPIVRLMLEAKSPTGTAMKTAEFGADSPTQRGQRLTTEWTWCAVEWNDIPKDTTELLFHVVLRSYGDVFVDDVQLYDFWLTSDEQTLAQRQLDAAGKFLQERKYASARRQLHNELVHVIVGQQNLVEIAKSSQPQLSATLGRPQEIPLPNQKVVDTDEFPLRKSVAKESTRATSPAAETTPLVAEFERLPPVDEPLSLERDELPTRDSVLPKVADSKRAETTSRFAPLPAPPLPSQEGDRTSNAKPAGSTNWFQRLITPQPVQKQPSLFR